MEPLTFEPLLKHIRWGGQKLGTVLGKPVGDATDCAESWEIADQPSGQSIVACGPHAGKTLNELIHTYGDKLLGENREVQQFPLLIKFLDANDWLSLQVHPNDRQAKQYDPNENGKTEAWVILDAEPGSQICAGLKADVSRDEFERHLRAGSVEETLHMIPARAGDCVFVPAQTVHALGPGILLAEVQQQSNLTFRLHDWGRVGSDGQPREIHIDEAMACIDFDRGPVNPASPTVLQQGNHTVEDLVHCSYFRIRRHTLPDAAELKGDGRFRILMVLDGEPELSTESGKTQLHKGTTVLLPASLPAVTMNSSSKATILEVDTPE